MYRGRSWRMGAGADDRRPLREALRLKQVGNRRSFKVLRYFQPQAIEQRRRHADHVLVVYFRAAPDAGARGDQNPRGSMGTLDALARTDNLAGPHDGKK